MDRQICHCYRLCCQSPALPVYIAISKILHTDVSGKKRSLWGGLVFCQAEIMTMQMYDYLEMA